MPAILAVVDQRLVKLWRPANLQLLHLCGLRLSYLGSRLFSFGEGTRMVLNQVGKSTGLLICGRLAEGVGVRIH